MPPSRLSFEERASVCLSVVAKRLFHLLDDKKTNLALAVDVNKSERLLELANLLGPEICLLKTHIDIITDFTPHLMKELRKLAQKHRFLIFEDRKFADIGNIVKQQYEGGIYRIADWADIVNAHPLPGPGIVEGLATTGRKKNRGLLLIAELSSAGNLLTVDYIKSTLKMAEQFADFVIGFITQRLISNDPHWINLTPGIQLQEGQDTLGQRYVTPERAILENGTDVIIVGRGILDAKDPLATAQTYREHAWDCYQRRISKR